METQTKVGTGVKFERIRRVTGYLAGDVRRFNNAKRAEEKDRVKHTMEGLNVDATNSSSRKIN